MSGWLGAALVAGRGADAGVVPAGAAVAEDPLKGPLPAAEPLKSTAAVAVAGGASSVAVVAGAALVRALKLPEPDAPALAGTDAPPPNEKGPGAVDAAGTGALLDATAAAVADPSVGMALLALVAPGLEASVASALLDLGLLSAGAPKLKVVIGAAAGAAAGTGTAGVGAEAGPKLNCPREAADPDCCPDCAGSAAQTAKICPKNPQLADLPTDLLLHLSQSCDGQVLCAKQVRWTCTAACSSCAHAKCNLSSPCAAAQPKYSSQCGGHGRCCILENNDEPAVVEGADNCSLAPPATGVAPVGVEADGAGMLTATVADGANASEVDCCCFCCC